MPIDLRREEWRVAHRAMPHSERCPTCVEPYLYTSVAFTEACVLCREGRAGDHAHGRCDFCGQTFAFAEGRRVA